MNSAHALILQRLRNGGEIKSSAAFTPTEIAIARANGRMVVDDDGFGYIYVPERRIAEVPS